MCWPDPEIYISNQNAIIRGGFTHRAARQRIESGEVLSHYSVYSLLIAANPTHCTALDSAQVTDWSHSHILCQWSPIMYINRGVQPRSIYIDRKQSWEIQSLILGNYMSGDFIIIYLSVHFECIALAVQRAGVNCMKSKLLTPVSCPPGSGQEPRMSPPAVSCFSCQLSAVLCPSSC